MFKRGNNSSGGDTPKWILDATISGSTFSAEWNYDAETVMMLVNVGTIKAILLYDVATKALWDADGTYTKWSYYGIDNRVTITPRSILGNYNQNVSVLSIIPLANKPNGYFA